MARVIFGVVLFSMVFAQATIIPALNPLNVSPDFVLLLLFVVTLFAGVREGLAWLFVAGILTDVLAMDPLGANGLALLPAVVLVEPARLPVFRANLLIPLVLVLVATLLHGLIQGLIRGMVPDITLVLQALLHAILFPLFYLLLRWLE
ncbi:MAG TPA: rod shape-determining protein MreD [Thermomicrobiales bacterium]|nr:rod shape-determining protein MreD [Thermomicrobiales bacterium]